MNIIWNFINLSGIWKYELPRNGQLVGELVGQTQLLWSFISMSVFVSFCKLVKVPDTLQVNKFHIPDRSLPPNKGWNSIIDGLQTPANRTSTCDVRTFTEVQIIRLLVQVCRVNRDLASTLKMRMQSTPWYPTCTSQVGVISLPTTH